jgi:signal peptidase II
MNVTQRLAIIAATLFGCVGCDQSTKHVARILLEGREAVSMLGGVLRLVYAENAGGFLGVGATLPAPTRTVIFLVASSFLVAVLLAYAVMKRDIGRASILALALIVGGGVGNLIDRIVNDGGVIDFLYVGVGPVRTGIFNVADMAVMLGTLMLVLSARKARNCRNLGGPAP